MTDATIWTREDVAGPTTLSAAGTLIKHRIGNGAAFDFDHEAAQRRPSWVYFIGAGSQAIKIGRGRDVPNRLAMLQIGNHLELTVLAKLYGAETMERACHRHCDRSRMRGEWFEPTSKVLGLVDFVLLLAGRLP
jgi:hypothetical protein